MRVFIELTPECDYTTQLYAMGYEKKEIAEMKNRAVSTINNQLQSSFPILKVRNGRELAIKLAERLTGQEIKKRAIAVAFIAILLLDVSLDTHSVYRARTIRTRYRNEQTV